MNKKVAIIGAGYTGLSCAKKLCENGFDVTIFEATNEIGGIAKCIDCYNTKIEKHYRHIFKSDRYVIKLIKELGIDNRLKWNETQMAYYSKDGIYKFGTPNALLKYKPLNLKEKLKFGTSIIRIKLIKNYKDMEKCTANEWICKHCGESVYKKIWKPLLVSKFGDKEKEISMSWLWGKIKLRSSSSTFKGEKLGYIEGSFDILTQKLKEDLLKNNCKILYNEKVEKVEKNNDSYIVKTRKIKR